VSAVVIKINSDAIGFLRSWEGKPKKILRAIADVMDDQNNEVIRIVKQYNRGRGPYPVGQHRLGHRTGKWSRSMFRERATISGTTVTSGIGNRAVYARIHEFGGRTRPHKIVASPGKALAFTVQNFFGVNRFSFQTKTTMKQARLDARMNAYLATGNLQWLKTGGGKRKAAFYGQGPVFFRHSVMHPGSNIPARAPISTVIFNRAHTYGNAISDAIVRVCKGGGRN
jgi:phage gpG-like protein